MRSKKQSPGIRGNPVKSGERSPTAHRTLEQVQAHGRTYQAKKSQIKKRVKRDQARRVLAKEGAVRKGQDVDHKKPLRSGGSNARSNLRAVSRSANRGHGASRQGNRPKSRGTRGA